MANKMKCYDCRDDFYPCYLKTKKIPCKKDKEGREYKHIDLCTKCDKKRKKAEKKAKEKRLFSRKIF